MKTINLLSVLLIISVHILAQVPQSFNYQAVVRDSNGELVTDQSVGVQISILKYGIYDLPVYIEDHNVLTNQFGLFSIMIGQGTQVMGEFEMIEWGSNTYFLQTAIDIGGENNYEFMGKTQLVSVPYSIYSRGLILTDENGNEYEITVDPSGNLVTNQILPFNCGDNLTDSRDGKIYLTVQIGNQCWMAENLNIGESIGSSVGQSDNDIIEKYCYDNNSTNCDTYGGMYTWDELMEYTSDSVNQGICPEGWIIPTDEQLKILEGAVDNQFGIGDPVWDQTSWRGLDAGGNLKESGLAHWFNPNTGATNSSGFTLLPSGIYDGSAFVGIHYGTFLWCSSETTPLNAVIRNIDNSHASTSKGAAAKSYALSLRCIQNSMLENFPPNAPSNPTPEDGANDQDINVDISWTCSDPENDPLTYDVYFGINNPPDLVSSNQSAATYDPSQLDYGTTYFWKIIAQDYTQMIESNIWSFSTIPNLPPAEPSNPSPEDGAEDQSINSQLSWSCTDPEMDPLTYDVYLGNIVDPPLFASGITSTTFNPGTLNSSATYYWKIIANDNHQNNTPSPVWSFETEFICGDQINYAGQDYNTIQIGTQCWFAENLNVGIMISAPTTQINNSTIEKYCYDNNITNCDTYGGLYRWDEMMEYSQISGSQGICPEEWHIPTDPEWCILENFVDDGTIDCNSTGWRGINAGSNLKETGTAHWYNPNYGTNSSGFTALPGGEYCSSTFSQLGISGIFWSSDKNVYDEQEAWERKLAYNKSQISRDVKHRDCTSSLRCIKN